MSKPPSIQRAHWLVLIAILATAPDIAAQLPKLSAEGEHVRALHDYLFDTYAEGRNTVYRGDGRDRSLKELTILEKTTAIRDGDEIMLPAGTERIAVPFRHFGFHGKRLDRIKEVRVFPFSPDKASPRSVQVKDFYRVQICPRPCPGHK